jgi:hypothetical protein
MRMQKETKTSAMNKRHTLQAQCLTYAGVIPFIATALNIIPIMHGVFYGAVIISFICGIHWAVFLFHSEQSPRNLLITSNLIALGAWVSLLLSETIIAIFFQSLFLLHLLTLDYRLHRAAVIPTWFFHLRVVATAIVTIAQMIVIVRI